MKQKSDNRLPLFKGGDDPPPPSPPSWHEKWKLAHIGSSGSYTSDIDREISERIQYEHYGNRPPPSPVAEHAVAPIGRSDKGSCSAASALGDDMDDTRPCHLYILSPIGTMLVARGIVYETTTVVHGVELAEDEVKVVVDEVIVPNALVLVPTKEFFTMEEAFKSFVAWPRHLAGDVSDPLQTGKDGSPTPKKTHLFEDDSLGVLDELLNIISDKPMIIPWDSTIFRRDAQIPLYLHQPDVR
ncbi:hypothetical protein LR48_Vigan08g069400 [Vigna angularis]|uniref:DUF8039 domain-containing protein n=1 Tax=Phaseolus angularis TaxID=3914 RepID=A0A0L9V4I2_PHAAN|nr:hypothetical protein LR48_Vigan08g069400 [Vigna angularis]